MAVNPDFVGRTYPPSGPYAVDAALIAAFAAAVGSADPVHTDAEAARAAGYADVIAPPTMAVRFSQAAERAYVADRDLRERTCSHGQSSPPRTTMVDVDVARASPVVVDSSVRVVTIACPPADRTESTVVVPST